MKPQSLLRLATRQRLSTPAFQTRTFITTARARFPRTNSQDKDSINTEATEYTRSGTDDGAAKQQDAFDPSKTRPEQEKGEGSQQNESPLDVSPANTEVSKQRNPQEGGPEKSDKEEGGGKQSGSGSPKKAGRR